MPDIQRKEIKQFYADEKRVPDNFEYSSGNNDWWLTVEDMRQLIEEINKGKE